MLNGVGDFLRESFGGSGEVDDDPNTYESEHSKNKTPSNLPRHEEGQARKQQDKDGEKKNKHPGWKPNRNKRRSNLGDMDFNSLVGNAADDEEAA